jgi:hypothetical protein
MLRLRPTLALAVLLAPVVAHAQSDPALWRFVYPNAKALISIDWARIRQTQAGAMIQEKFLSAGAMPAIPGLELLDDMDRVLISSPGKNSDDDSSESPILVAIHGHFDSAKVRAVFTHFGAKPQSYNSFQVYRPQGRSEDRKDMAWVLFDAETILFGDAPSIFATLDRNRFASAAPQSPPAAGSIAARAAEMEAAYEFWIIMDAAEIVSTDQIAALFRGGEWASEAQGFDAGVNLRTGLAADITVRFSSDATAKRITTELTRIVNLAAKDKSAGAQMQDIAKRLKFNVDGSAAKISLRLSQQELEKSAQAFAAGLQAAARNTASVERSNPNPTPAITPVTTPSKPGVIRIEGLDEGTREIPFQDPRN